MKENANVCSTKNIRKEDKNNSYINISILAHVYWASEKKYKKIKNTKTQVYLK